MKIVFVYDDRRHAAIASRQRCRSLAALIHRYSRWSAAVIASQDFTENHPAAAARCAAADLIVLQRGLHGNVHSAVQRWKALDKVLAVDLDEAYYLLPDGGRQSCKELRRLLQLVHAVVAVSPRLADDWRGLAPVFVLPGYPDLAGWENLAPVPHDGIVLGWWGGQAQVEGFMASGLAEALVRVCAARPDARVLLGEPEPNAYNRLQLAPEQKIYAPLAPGEPAFPLLSRVDIALASASGAYDDRLGPWKLLEAMLLKIPWLASESAAYWELRAFGRLVSNRPRSWEAMLNHTLAEIQASRAFAAGSPYIYALSQELEVNVDKVLAVYQAVVRQTHQS